MSTVHCVLIFCCDFHHSPSHLLASKSILKATEEYGMESVSSPYLTTLRSKQEVEDEIRKALTVLKESEYNYFVAAFYPEMLGTIMGIAYLNMTWDWRDLESFGL